MKIRTQFLTGIVVAASCFGLANAQNDPANDPGRVDLVATTEALSPEQEKAAFVLPPGFEAQLVAAEPDVHKPMNLAFDDLGRLWVTSSLEYPFPAKDGTVGRDQVLIFSDFGPDGRARKRQVFADGLNIPIGLIPLSPSEALVHSIPAIWRLTDTDGDGKADKKEQVYQQYGQRDTHGMTNAFTWGFDGWLYACHGFNNDSTIKAADGSTISLSSGNTYRMKADGSHVERHTNGQVNPFGIAQDEWGNLFTSDCHSKPIYQLLKGAYYPSFGKPHDGMGFGPDMIRHDHYSTGIAGIAIDTGSQFPEEYRGRAWIGNVVTSRINHDRFERTGGTLEAKELPDFLVSKDPWFRPVDLKFGPDGALYVADFYNRIIGHYEVPLQHPGRDRERGRIWRIVYKGDKAPDTTAHAKASTTDWTKAGVDELVAALTHPNMVVRVRATNHLADRGGDAAVEPLSKILAAPVGEANAKSHALWVLHRTGKLKPEQLAAAAQDPQAVVRSHAMRVLADAPASEPLWRVLAYGGLKDTDGLVRRNAAEALGQGPAAEQATALLTALEECPEADTHQRHVIRMAIRNHLVKPQILEKVSTNHRAPAQMAALADCALGAHSRESAAFVRKYVTTDPAAAARRDEFAAHVARYGSDGELDALIAWGRGSLDKPGQVNLSRAISQGRQAAGQKPLKAQREWTSGLVRELIASNAPETANQMTALAELAATMGLTDLAGPLANVGKDNARPQPIRVAALESVTRLNRPMAREVLSRLMADADHDPAMRDQAAGVLGRMGQAETDAVLVEQIATAPARLQQSIAVALVQRPAGAEALLAAVEAGKASARLLQIRPVENKLKQTDLRDRDARLAKATKGIPPGDERIAALIGERKSFIAGHKGNAANGLGVFTKNCATCHRIGETGARIGPQLDGVGVRGVERLLEDILDPNRNVDQAFRSTTIATKEGQILTGLLLRDEGEVLVLADSQGKDVRVAKADVAEQTVNPLSPMPANWADALKPEELTDLISYLLDQKTKVKAILP